METCYSQLFPTRAAVLLLGGFQESLRGGLVGFANPPFTVLSNGEIPPDQPLLQELVKEMAEIAETLARRFPVV